ncbi:histidine phosphatase family protein [Paeniglutamicibacter antarcticus]|uniref:Histidine phosphatase family protein n=1 Tax=Arthrobacter terrae TaxID=2935737 RepID=A0A931CU50_9MICC|nr:histidine phosphatase family protein [Arthrobacter terrae]MBG0740956.1 histidine phosphatase family protein [Arthrobacter terrae]
MSSSGIWQPANDFRRVVFWRHGRTLWNAEQRFQGQADIELDDVGRAQADKAAALLAAVGPARLVSSDLRRAKATAQALADLTGLDISTDPRLRETYAGSWQGLTFEQIADDYPTDLLRWERDDISVRAGGGETRIEVAERMRDGVLEALSGVESGETLIVATHGGAARVAIARLMGLPYEYWGTLSGLSNCNWSVLQETGNARNPGAEGSWKLTEHNAGTLPEPQTEPVED